MSTYNVHTLTVYTVLGARNRLPLRRASLNSKGRIHLWTKASVFEDMEVSRQGQRHEAEVNALNVSMVPAMTAPQPVNVMSLSIQSTMGQIPEGRQELHDAADMHNLESGAIGAIEATDIDNLESGAIVCKAHRLEVCGDCGIDYRSINRLKADRAAGDGIYDYTLFGQTFKTRNWVVACVCGPVCICIRCIPWLVKTYLRLDGN